MFTRQHYEVVASVLAQANLDCGPECRWAVVGVAVRLAAMFKEDNPNFNRDRFYLKAAILEDDQGKVISFPGAGPDS